MLKVVALQPYHDLGVVRRLRPIARPSVVPTLAEFLTLLAFGALAALAVIAISPELRIPGHAILRAALPVICGLAFVPRRLAGSSMSLCAAAAVLGLSAMGFRDWQFAAFVALLALGPAIDIALLGAPTAGWRLYLRFALAGIAANSLSFAVRLAMPWFQPDAGHTHTLAHFGLGVFLSFAACGAVAGLLGAAACFRASPRRTTAKDPG